MRSGARSMFRGEYGGEKIDRRFYKAQNEGCKLLKISILLMMMSGQLIFAQETNEKIYFSIVQDLWSINKTKIGSLDGFVPSALKSEFLLDTASTKKLEISLPQIEFQKLESGKFQREVSGELVLTDSVPQTLGLTRIDTISRKDISKIRKSVYPELKGSDPRPLQKYVWPGLGVSGGIGAIISLFYIRSSAQ